MKTAITLLDSYKLGHIHQYPDNTTKVYSNFTPRASKIDGVDKVVFVGLQYFLERYLGQEFDKFFDSDFDDVVDSYQRRLDTYLGPNTVGTDHIQDLYNLGYLPLEFKALPEGTRVPLRIPMLTVENTHPNFAWLVNYLETLMSSILWLPCTSATTAHHFRELLEFHANKTGSPIEFVNWQGHDFSFRGMAGPEAASMSGFGHLTSFTGTDTIPAVEFVEDYYGDGLDPNYLIGASVPATEHSVMCAGGELSEKETFERIIKLYPSGIVSVVSDTWDLWKVLTNILPELKEDILARDGKFVIRPDSGNPADIVCGMNTSKKAVLVEGPANKGVIELLWDEFGGTVNEAGYKVLDPHVGCLYGDAITYERAEEILTRLESKGFASCNMVFGLGSFTYQYKTRDTFGFAMKATWAEVDGQGIALFKDPVTDDGVKKSAVGRLAVLRNNEGELYLYDRAPEGVEKISLLETVWKDGKFTKTYTIEDIRNTVKNS